MICIFKVRKIFMAIGNLFGSGGESNSLYGTSLTSGGSIPAASSFIYFEWFIFKTSSAQPTTPTGGTWDFLTNTGTPPTGWTSTVSGIPLDSLWFSIAFVDSRNPTVFNWSTPGLISATTSIYATAYADTFTGNGSTVNWTLTVDPVVVNNLDVSINGVTQTPTVDYTISGTTFTTTTAAPLGSILLVKYRQALPNSYFGTANNVGYTPHNWIAATNVQSALNEVADDISATDGVSGSNLVGYKPAGTGAVATTVQAKLRQNVSVLDYGADSTGVASSVTAFNAALLNGGTVYVPSGTYKLDGKVTLSIDGTTLLMAAKTTLNVSGVAAIQSPFGAQILISANNCAIIGSGPSSLIQNVLGTRANTVTLVPGYVKFLMRDLTLDGGKSLVTSEETDTFESGIMLIGYATTTPSDIEATINNVTIKNYAQYGISMYGNQCNGVKIINCNIRDMGITGQAFSVGAGIVAAIAGSNLTIANNTIKNCKQNGMFISSAGVASGNHVIANNTVLTCGASGIAYLEQANYGSVSGVGIVKIAVTGNVCIENTRSGIQFNVDTVGFLKQIAITGNVCSNNTYGGIELNCSNTPPNILSDVVVFGNQATGNGTVQIAAGQYVTNIQGISRSFTPIVYGSTSVGTATYVSQYGSYTQNGNIVTFELEVEWSAHTGTGDLVIGGLPIAAANSEPQSTNFVFANGLTITGQGVWGPSSNQTYNTLGAINNGAYSAVAMDTSALLRITGTYFS
jgi:hypothetical protein